MYSSNVIALGVAAMKGTETEQRIAVLLYDDNFQVISSFELNQIASLTYHEGSLVNELDYAERIIEQILTIISKPADYSPLSIEKALVITKHILIFGATKVIHNVRSTLGRYIEPLQQYNSALLAQQQPGAAGFFVRLKGGAVDKGGNVRELAITLTGYLYNEQLLNFERNTQADPNSLVPIGDRKKISYISDEARLRYVKRKMEQHQAMEQRSNLAKGTDGFGSGYMSRDGKNVVGAAHGIDVMIQQAQREQKRFTDDTSYRPPEIDVDELRQYAKEFEQQHKPEKYQQQLLPQPEVDLLGFDPNTNSDPYGQQPPPQQEVDLLGFGAEPIGNTASHSVFDADLFGVSTPYTAPSPDVGHVANASDLLSIMSLSNDPTPTTISSSSHDPFAVTSSSTTSSFTTPSEPQKPPPPQQQPPPQQPMKKMVMANTANDAFDRFAALDFAIKASNDKTIDLQNSSLHDNGPSSPTPRNSINIPAGSLTFGDQNGSTMKVGLGSLSGLNDVFANPPLATRNDSTSNNTFGSLGYNTNVGMSTTTSISDVFSGLVGNNNPTTSLPSMTLPNTNLGSIQVSQGYVPSNIDDDDIASGFVMGGTAGTGLDPIGQAPAAPPPPPPPPGTEW